MPRNERFKAYKTTAVLPRTRVKSYSTPGMEKFKKALVVAVLLAGAYYFLAGNTGLIKLIGAKMSKARLENEIAKIEESNRKAAAEIFALKSDLKTVERIAREELGLIKKGEVVYKFIIKKEEGNAGTGDRNSDKH